MVHIGALVLAAKLPSAQLVHAVAPFKEYVPAAQPVHVEEATAPVAVEYKPAAQLRHVAAPLEGW